MNSNSTAKSGRENIYSLKGFSKVFKFTLKQTFKNKGFLASFIVFVLVMTLMQPLQYFMAKSTMSTIDGMDSVSLEDIEVDKIYIINETPVELSADDIAVSDEDGGNLSFVNVADKTQQEVITGLGKKEGLVAISMDESGFKVNGIVADESEISASDINSITNYINDMFSAKRIVSSGLSEDDIKTISSGIYTNGVSSADEYEASKHNTISQGEFAGVATGFALVILVVVSLSNSYIVTSVNEEKQSKLVETLLVSVRPMALLFGKVCGMMSYVILLLVCGFTGSKISGFVMEHVVKADTSLTQEGAFDLSIFTNAGIKGMAILVVSILLSYAIFGLMSGLLGSACSKTEDLQNATGTLMFIAMLGYMGIMAIMTVEKPIIYTLSALIPPFSMYSAPVLYLSGRISGIVLVCGLLIQIVVLIGIAVLCAKTYRNLLLSDNSTPKLKAIFKSSK